MAKTQKYSEDVLLEAVVKFAEIEKGKIKATELARWAAGNFPGLEEVKAYQFTRPMKEKDNETGKVVEKPKLCALKIEEINKARNITNSINTNLLLRAANIDSFLELSNSAKRKMIVETRETVDKLLLQNGTLKRENEALKSKNQALKEEIKNVTDKINLLAIAQKKLTRQVNYIMRITDERKRTQMLAEMGITDGDIDLNQYNASLQMELKEVMNLNKLLQKYATEVPDDLETHEDIRSREQGEKTDMKQLTTDIMSGLDF